jgi:hypothetical protein
MNLPDRMKKNYKLYREILVKLSPEIASINNSEWQFPITSWKLPFYGLARRIYFSLPDPIRKFVEYRLRWSRLRGAYSPDSPVRQCLGKQIESGSLDQYLNPDKIREHIDSMEKMGFDHMFTLTSLIEKESTGISSIAGYADREMI